jgi:uncharacterized protein YkwD
MLRRIAQVSLAVGLTALAAPSLALAGDACPDVGAQPGDAQMRSFERAVVCLINRERGKARRPPLNGNRRLAGAGERQAVDMVRREFFSHSSPEGADVVDRLRRVGYVRPARRWMVAEVLCWNVPALSTPRATVETWMNSPPHRRALLDARFREIGAGAALGNPVSSDTPGVTVAVELGRTG